MTNLTDMLSKFVNSNTASSSGLGTLHSNTVTNPKEDLKGITTRSGVAYKGPTIPITSYSSPKVVERDETRWTKGHDATTNKDVPMTSQPTVVQYSSNYDDNLVNRIDVIDMACGEYSQEVPGFSDVIARGNPTPYYDQSFLPLLRPSLPSGINSKFVEAKNDKSSIDEPPEVELKDLPSHLEYAFLEGHDKFASS
ncbi:hypothetical protein Tco_0457815 [Tanacetum coccineum]